MPRLTDRLLVAPLAALFLLLLACPALAQQLPDPDGEPADMSKPVQVYLLMGQSNMVGSGVTTNLASIAKDKYPYLVDDDGNYTTRMDVRNVFIITSGNKIGDVRQNNWLTVEKKKIGPEIGIGHYLGEYTDAPVMILKSCNGNRSLGWDLLPPGIKAYEYDGKVYPGYRGLPDDPTGDTGGDMSRGWYAGCQYDGDVASAKHILKNLDTYYPGAKSFEFKGIFWWQGCKEKNNAAHCARYGIHLAQLVRALREEFKAPDAMLVAASIGETKMGAGGNEGKMMDAMIALSKTDDEEFKDKVGFVYSNPLVTGGSCGHYNNNVESYMNVGEAMGKAMVELLKKNGGEDGKKEEKKKKVIEQIDHQFREWTSKSGQTLTAKFISAEKGRVTLELENGQKRKYSSKSFSEEDQAYIYKYAQWGE